MAGTLKTMSVVRMRVLPSSPVTKRATTSTQDYQVREASTNGQTAALFSPRPFQEMPGPKGLPVLGTLLDYSRPKGLRFDKMFEAFVHRAKEYGPVYREQIGNRLGVVVTDPFEYAKVVRADGKTPLRLELGPMAYYREKKGLCLGPVNAQGEEWLRYRNALSKKMLRPREVVEYVGLMGEVVDDVIDIFKRTLDPKGNVPDLEFVLFKWSFESVCTFLFDERVGSFDNPPNQRAEDFIKNLAGFFHQMQALLFSMPIYKAIPTPAWKKFEKHSDNLHHLGLHFVHKKLNSLKEQSNPADGKVPFLTYLLGQTSSSPEEAVSHTIDLMMGGVETTSNALLWTLYNLAIFPQTQKDLYSELSRVLPPDGTITTETLNELQYAKACLKETFRLYPITFATSRITREDVEIGGYVVPPGVHVQANLYGMGHDPGLFPDPEVFRPERWIRGTEDNDPTIQAFTTLPWGHGPRMCLGRRVAEQEIYIALSKIVHAFEVDFKEPEKVQPILQTVMVPDRPIKLIFKPRPPRREISNVSNDVMFGMPAIRLPDSSLD